MHQQRDQNKSTKLEPVTSFKYLGSVITDEGSKPEIHSRIAQTTAALTRLKPVWNIRSISLSSKIQLMGSLVTSIFLYACESWTLTAELCLARWFWPVLMNGKHDHTTAVCVLLRSSGNLHVVQLHAGSWQRLPRWYMCSILR